MTLSEYMDPTRFPETTQPGLTPKQQLLIDAFNYDQIREYFETGGQLNDEQIAAHRELIEKMIHQSTMIAALNELEARGK